jgi:hypothetical protein
MHYSLLLLSCIRGLTYSLLLLEYGVGGLEIGGNRLLDSKYRCHARKGNFYNFGPALHDHFIVGCTEFMQVNSR